MMNLLDRMSKMVGRIAREDNLLTPSFLRKDVEGCKVKADIIGLQNNVSELFDIDTAWGEIFPNAVTESEILFQILITQFGFRQISNTCACRGKNQHINCYDTFTMGQLCAVNIKKVRELGFEIEVFPCHYSKGLFNFKLNN